MEFKLLRIIPTFIFFIVCVSGEEQDISLACLGCICDAASGCNTTIGCTGDLCGPFRITQYYWADGGKPTIDGESDSDDDAYKHCANDANCAAEAVKKYMEKYAQDCNSDGKVDCDDYARIHKLGGFGCSGSLDQTYEDEFTFCHNTFKKL